MPVVKANGIDIYHELAGQGEPVVVIGGLGTDSTLLRPIVGGLAGQFKVLSFDNRGAGRTSQPDMPYSVETMATDTVELMDVLDITRAHVLGVSMGASTAMAVALAHPAGCKSRPGVGEREEVDEHADLQAVPADPLAQTFSPHCRRPVPRSHATITKLIEDHIAIAAIITAIRTVIE